MSCILTIDIVEIELEMHNVLGVVVVKINAWTHCTDLSFVELLEVVGEVVAAYPDLTELTLAVKHLLAGFVVCSEWKHWFKYRRSFTKR